MLRYYKVGEFAKLIGKNQQTLRNWDNEGVFKPHHVTESGHRYYSQEQLDNFLGIVTVFSCRLPGKRTHKAKKFIKDVIADD